MTPMGQGSSEESIRFSLVEGGPFHQLLGRLGLLGPDSLPNWRTAFSLALLAWLPPMLLVVAQTLLDDGYSGWNFFTDPTVYTRYLVAIVAMLITERIANKRISILLDQFLKARLLDPDARDEYRGIVKLADRRVSWPWVEGFLLLLAMVWSWLSFYYVAKISVSGWEETSRDGESYLSWAAGLAELMSNPIFLFLLFRWFWRFLVWALLLYRISCLPLRLATMHPDHAGGLGFLALFPGIFSGFVFALSCVVSSSLLKTIDLVPTSQAFIWLAIGGWVLLILLVLIAPLLAFSAPMLRARETALIEFGQLVQSHHRAFHKKWLGSSRKPEDLLGSPDPSSVADLNAAVETAFHMRVIPLDFAAVLQILVISLLPFVIVVVSQVPLTQLLAWLVGAIF